MVPILPAEAAGLEDTERVEILELVESYMDSRETAVMTGDTESLKAVSCTDIATGAGGHRYGLCQMGAALRAKNGDSASNILLYYYTDCRIISCTLK